MPINILMPALSPTMEEGTLARWLVSEGDSVSSGTLLAEIETDKATMEFESVEEGTIGKIVVPEGTEGVRVNDVIAVMLEDGESADALRSTAAAPKPTTSTGSGNGKSGAEFGPKPPSAPPSPRHHDGSRILASPLARRLAADRGLDLADIVGSGPNGRIVKADIERAGPGRPAAPAAAVEPEAGMPDESIRRIYADRDHADVFLDGMRKSIAARLAEAKRTIPHFYLRRDIRIDALLGLRAELNKSLGPRQVRLSVNDFIIKAAAVTLQQVPECNAVWAGDRLLRFAASDIAVAVAVEGGLFTPVLRDVESKTLSTISREMKDLAERARARKLAPTDYLGGSMSISNLGMMGIESFDAVINPPQASILAVGAGVSKPVSNEDGSIATATLMSVTMSVDHRVIDGALGAEFLARLTENLEQPVAMLA